MSSRSSRSKKQQSPSSDNINTSELEPENTSMPTESDVEVMHTDESTNASNPSPSTHPDNKVVAQLMAKLKTLELEKEDWKEKAYRFSADAQNIAKQSELDIAQAKKFGKKSVITSLSQFFNSLNLAFSFTPQTEDPNVHAFVRTLKTSFDQAVRDIHSTGVELLVPTIGESINPEFMTILNPENSDEDEPTVKQVVSIGIRIDGQLIQPASVMV